MSPNRRVRVDRSVRTHTSEHLTGRRVTSPSLCIQQLNRVQDLLAAGHETAIYAPAAGAGSVRSDPARRNANRAERARKTTGAECSSRRVQNARIVIENSAENRRSERSTSRLTPWFTLRNERRRTLAVSPRFSLAVRRQPRVSEYRVRVSRRRASEIAGIESPNKGVARRECRVSPRPGVWCYPSRRVLPRVLGHGSVLSALRAVASDRLIADAEWQVRCGDGDGGSAETDRGE